MRIIKVVVSKIPESCGSCPYALIDDFADCEDDEDGLMYFCSALPVLPPGVQDNGLGDLAIADRNPPDWCPLEDQGGFVIEDQLVARSILNKEIQWIGNRIFDKDGKEITSND